MEIFKFRIAVLFLVSVIAALPSVSFDIRQTELPPSCFNDTDCSQQGCVNDSVQDSDCNEQDFFHCDTVTGWCICHECFILNSITNRCYTMPPCTDYDNTTGQCIDRRKKQLTAFLLALFLTWTGAANFYINRLEYAIPQLIFGLMCCSLSCITKCARDSVKDSEEGGVKVCIGCCIGIPACLLTLLFFSWTLVDLIILGTNQRVDGNGCALIESF